MFFNKSSTKPGERSSLLTQPFVASAMVSRMLLICRGVARTTACYWDITIDKT
jgi:hypothetical protein